jgi:hypothetical protein
LPLVGHVGDVVVAVLADGLRQARGRHAGDRGFARGIDVGDNDHVGLVEGARELVEQIAGARVAVGLKGDDDAAVVGALSGVERGFDFSRMMAVVVDQRDAPRLSHDRKAPSDAPERGEGLLGEIERHLELVGDGDDREAILHVVRSRHVHHEFTERFAAPVCVKVRAKAVVPKGFRAVVGLGRHAVGHVPARNARQDVLHVRVIEAHHGKAIKRHPAGEFDERLLDLVVGAVVVEVLGVDVGHHGDGGGEAQERAVALVGLGDQKVAGAESRVRPERRHLAADDHGGVEARRAQHGGDERSGGRLAMRARDGDAIFDAHQLGQHFRAPDDRRSQRARLEHLGIFRGDGTGEDDHVGAAHVGRAVPEVDADAHLRQAMGDLVGAKVRTGNVEFERVQDLGEPAHADAADADEVNVANASPKHGRLPQARADRGPRCARLRGGPRCGPLPPCARGGIRRAPNRRRSR